MNSSLKVLTIVLIVLISVFPVILLPGCSTTGAITPVTPADSPGEATMPPEQSTKTPLPYVFEGIMQAGVQNAPPVEVIMDIPLPEFPDEVPVYSVEPVTEEYITSLARRLGFNDEPRRTSNGSYNYSKGWDYVPKTVAPPGSYSLEVHPDGSFRMVKNLDTRGVPNLPSFEQAITIAREWLVSHDLYPPNVSRVEKGGGVVTTRVNIETGEKDTPVPHSMVVNFITRLGDIETGLGASVWVGENGDIQWVSVNNSQFRVYGTVKLKTLDSALNILKAHLASPLSDPPETKECVISMRNFDLLTVTKITLQYAKGGGYLQPIYVFEGDASSQNSPNVEHFTGKVDAVSR